MSSQKSRILQGSTLMGLSALLFASQAIAQTTQNIASLTSATPAGDWSMRMWTSLFGAFASDPFSTLGGPTTLLGGIFLIFNGCIFTVGFAWALYGILGGVVSTAHEGEVLGRRMSTVWFPIRMITGIAGMVPIFGGFTLNQAVMMFLTTLGIGIGNAMWTGAVNNTNQFQGLMQNQSFSPTGTSAIRDAAKDMFFSNVCLIAQGRDLASRPTQMAGEQLQVANVTHGGSGTQQYSYGSVSNPMMCGYVSVQATDRSAGMTALSFRSGAVNYDAIADAARASYIAGLGTLQGQIRTISENWYQASETARNQAGVAQPPAPLTEIDAAVNSFIANTTASITQSTQNSGALNGAAQANMLAVGWFGAGAWFSTFAEVNAGIADAAKGPIVKSDSGVGRGVSSTASATVISAKTSFETALKARSAGATTGDPTRAILDSAISDTCVAPGGALATATNTVLGTATGNCSLGQSIVSAAIRATAVGSGGGGNGGGSLGFDSQGFVNPIIMMKNMGDYVMTFSSTVILANGAMSLFSGAVDSIANKIPGGATVVAMATKSGSDGKPSGIGSAWSVLSAIAVVTLVLGAAMAIYCVFRRM